MQVRVRIEARKRGEERARQDQDSKAIIVGNRDGGGRRWERSNAVWRTRWVGCTVDEVEQTGLERASWSVDGGWWMVSGIEMNRIVVIKSSPAVDPGFKFGKKARPGQGVRVDWVTG